MGLESHGLKESPVWLIGDSDPKNSGSKLKHVFDDRHPVIHNIWTPIIYRIQKKLYREKNKMIEDDDFYVTNAISDPGKRPKENVRSWDTEYLEKRMQEIKALINNYNPPMIITFGSFAFEFIRRCEGEEATPYKYWNTEKMHEQFLISIENKKRVIPLLHRSISMGHFLTSHGIFSDDNKNYFKFVSENLYTRMIDIMKW